MWIGEGKIRNSEVDCVNLNVTRCWQINRYSVPTGMVILSMALLHYSCCTQYPKTGQMREKVSRICGRWDITEAGNAT